MLEKFITMTPEEFSTYMRLEVPQPVEGEQAEKPRREAYRYAKVGPSPANPFYEVNKSS